MKYAVLFLLSLGVTGCGTINTPHDGVDAIYNTTSAVIKGTNTKEACTVGHVDDRKNCRRRTQAETNAISESIRKHRRDIDVQ